MEKGLDVISTIIGRIGFRQKTIIARASNPRYACHLHEAVRSGSYTCRLLQDKCYQGSDFKKQITQYWEKEEPTLINDLRDDVRSECSRFGEVKNVKIFDNHPDGVMMVYFKTAESADECIAALHHRWFSKRRIMATTWDGRTKFEIEESEAEREERLAKWETFLDSDDTKQDKESDHSKDKMDTTQSNSDNNSIQSANVDNNDAVNTVQGQSNDDQEQNTNSSAPTGTG